MPHEVFLNGVHYVYVLPNAVPPEGFTYLEPTPEELAALPPLPPLPPLSFEAVTEAFVIMAEICTAVAVVGGAMVIGL
jgi:hypothetical protein